RARRALSRRVSALGVAGRGQRDARVAAGVTPMRVPCIFFVLAACGGQSLDMGFDDGRAANPDQPADLGAVRYRCDAAAGADEPYPTASAARAPLAGRWFLCEASVPDVLGAIEFTADGQWFALVANEAGVYARDASRSGTFSTGKIITCCYPDTWYIHL